VSESDHLGIREIWRPESGGRHGISVVGLGKIGLPLATCFAAKGGRVVGVDVDQAKIDAVNVGVAPLFEPKLQELLGQSRGRLRATADLAEAVSATEATFVVVATPSDAQGGFSLRHVLPVCQAIGHAMRTKEGFHLVVLTSTVMPGSTGGVVRETLEEASSKRCGVDFGLCYSPGFIALGSVIRDFLNPDFLLVGESDRRAGDILAQIYGSVCENDAPVARMNFVNAELTKLAVNTFVTTKIVFANTLARMCERLPEADADVVTGALGLDTRIGARYLRGAISYGGPCFPRDNAALAALARSIDAPALIAEATDRSNREGIRHLAGLVQEKLPDGGTVGVLGLSYKPNTDVVEDSASLLLVLELVAEGIDVVAFDPAAMKAATRVVGDSARLAESAQDCVRQADVVVIATPWREFANLDPSLFGAESRSRTVIDCWRMLTRDRFEGVAEYIVLGEGAFVATAVPRG
jgi:UDPglucose 6-dehydrogenase